jgi:hypothetical protein
MANGLISAPIFPHLSKMTKLHPDVTLIARGLVLDVEKQAVVATPFPSRGTEGGGSIARHRRTMSCSNRAEAHWVERAAASVAHLSDKEVGLRLNEFPADIRGLIFTLRKQKDSLLSGRSRQVIFRSIRPTGNELPGYVPSYAINRLQDESS